MRRVRLTRSSFFRSLALGAVVAPVWVAWSNMSCVLADPPPELPTLPTDVLSIQGSVVPPAGLFTNWPAGGLQLTVHVQVFDPTATNQFLIMEDYETSNSAPLEGSQFIGQTYNRYFSQTDPDGGSVESVPIPPIAQPSDPNCHTFSLFLAPATTSGSTTMPSLVPQFQSTGYIVSYPSGAIVINWLYSPSGGLGVCAAYDAAGLTDTTPDAVPDATVDGVIIPVVDGGD